MAHIAYKRVSTERQETERQFHNSNLVFDAVFEDKLSGKNMDRPQFMACLNYLKEGDTLHVWEISRMSRNLDDLRKTVFGLIGKGVNVKFHKEGLEFTGNEEDTMKFAMSKMQLNMIGAVGEFERGLISMRVKEGLAVARANGVKLGGSAKKHKLSCERKYVELQKRDEEYRCYLESGRKNGMTFRTLASHMNQLGVRSPKGKELTASTCQRMCVRLGIE